MAANLIYICSRGWVRGEEINCAFLLASRKSWLPFLACSRFLMDECSRECWEFCLLPRRITRAAPASAGASSDRLKSSFPERGGNQQRAAQALLRNCPEQRGGQTSKAGGGRSHLPRPLFKTNEKDEQLQEVRSTEILTYISGTLANNDKSHVLSL